MELHNFKNSMLSFWLSLSWVLFYCLFHLCSNLQYSTDHLCAYRGNGVDQWVTIPGQIQEAVTEESMRNSLNPEDCIGAKRTDWCAELLWQLILFVQIFSLPFFLSMVCWQWIKPPQTFQLLLNVPPAASSLLQSLRLESLSLFNGGACKFHC